MALLIEGCAVRASIAGNDASNRPHDVIGRKHLSRFIRSRSPLVAQLALLRHAGRPGALSELFYELGSVPRDRRRLSEARNGRDVCWLEAPVESEPLVTVRIATKDRPGLLVERALASALNQTYERIEILIVGDHCDERTQDALSLVSDPRIRYINLGRQGDYPTEPTRRWQVAGSSHPAIGSHLVTTMTNWTQRMLNRCFASPRRSDSSSCGARPLRYVPEMRTVR